MMSRQLQGQTWASPQVQDDWVACAQHEHWGLVCAAVICSAVHREIVLQALP